MREHLRTGPRTGRALARRALALLALALALATVTASAATTAPHVPAAERPCYGAASRDPEHPCRNPALRLTVAPSPLQAVLEPYAPCGQLPGVGDLFPCRFGTGAPKAVADIALVGDSHAGHWRAAVRAVALARGWRGTSMTRSGCSFTRAPLLLAPAALSACRRWNDGVVTWFRQHPEVHTVFVSSRAHIDVTASGGLDPDAIRRAGTLAAWRRLPPSVTTIIVLRDTPLRPLHTLDCVERAMALREPPGTSCATPRSSVLPPDPEVAAAVSLHGHRAHVADLSSFMCSARLCLPVVGGALVQRDQNHMTTAFAQTLAPFLLRRVDAILPPGTAGR